jgi:hypothetical protein
MDTRKEPQRDHVLLDVYHAVSQQNKVSQLVGVKMSFEEGGCLCGAIRYRTNSKPLMVMHCHCKFCQRATGAAYSVEPMFDKKSFEVIAGEPTTYGQTSEGSGKHITINFCSTCGTKLFLDLERFPDLCVVYGGTFDDPNWFGRSPKTPRHIFLDFAKTGTVIPAGDRTFPQHALRSDGTWIEPVVLEQHHKI